MTYKFLKTTYTNRKDETDNTKSMSTFTLALVIPFFKEIGELKRLLKSLQSDIKILTGNNTQTFIAARKGRSVASVLLLRLHHQVMARGVV